jgi:hypothetical protein
MNDPLLADQNTGPERVQTETRATRVSPQTLGPSEALAGQQPDNKAERDQHGQEVGGRRAARLRRLIFGKQPVGGAGGHDMKIFSSKTRQRTKAAVRMTKRSALFKADIALPPSRTQTGVRFRTFNTADERARAAQRPLPVFHHRSAHREAAIHPARGPARLTAACVSLETPMAAQRT